MAIFITLIPSLHRNSLQEFNFFLQIPIIIPYFGQFVQNDVNLGSFKRESQLLSERAHPLCTGYTLQGCGFRTNRGITCFFDRVQGRVFSHTLRQPGHLNRIHVLTI